MTQMASCSYCFYYLNYRSERVGLIRETKLTYAAGELMGVITGFYSIRLVFCLISNMRDDLSAEDGSPAPQ